MKNIIKLLSFAMLGLFLFTACNDNEEDLFIINTEETLAPRILSPDAGTPFVLSEENGTALALTLVWEGATYNVPTQVNYHVEFALPNTEFAEPYQAAETINTYTSWSVNQLNNAALALGLTPFSPGDIEVRVKSVVGTQEAEAAYSESILISVTPFTSSLPVIAVPGNHQDWSPGSAPLLAASAFGATDYEGFAWLDGEYKFIAPDANGVFDWGNTDWGDDGSHTGILVEEDEVNCIASPAGYYYIQADTGLLTYSTVQTTWGIIGSASPGGWDNDTPMTYDASTGKWSAIVTLTAESGPDGGGIKFRANGSWDVMDFGDNGQDGTLEFGGQNITTPSGTFLVELDLSNPRNYTYSFTPQ